MKTHLVGGGGLHTHLVAQGFPVESQVSQGSQDTFVTCELAAFKEDDPFVVLPFPGPFHDLRPAPLGIDYSHITATKESEKTGLPM